MNNHRYFYLNRQNFVVIGKFGAAIYDLYNEDIYSIDLEIGNLLNKLSSHKISVEEILENYDSIKKRQILEYLKQLQGLNLGFFKNRYFVNEKIKPTVRKDKLNQQPRPLKKMWIEITRRCNLNCYHCYNSNGTIERCSCTTQPNQLIDQPLKINVSILKKSLKDAKFLSCNEVHIIGGEPTLEKELLCDVIKYAAKIGIPQIILQTNLMVIENEIVNIIKKYNVIVQFTIFSYNPIIHDKITRTNGSHKNLKKNLSTLFENKISVRAIIEILRDNQDDVYKTVMFLKEIGIQNIYKDVIHSMDPNKLPGKFVDEYIKKNPENISGIYIHDYFRNVEAHPCWDGTIAVTSDGAIIPCIMARNEVLGNISNLRISELITNKTIEKYWAMTKDDIKGCRECEYRYACFDCRPRECENGDLYSMNIFCRIRDEVNKS